MAVERGENPDATNGRVPVPRFSPTELDLQSEVDDIQGIALLSDSHQKVIRRDVAVEVAFAMDVLQSRDGLIGEEEDRLHREFPTAVLQQDAERWAQ